MKTLFILGLFVFILSCNQSGTKNESAANDSISNVKEKAMAAKVTFKVSGMTCTGCENSIQTNVSKLDGVFSVKASHTDSVTVVTFDSTKISTEKIAEAINLTGYKVESNLNN